MSVRDTIAYLFSFRVTRLLLLLSFCTHFQLLGVVLALVMLFGLGRGIESHSAHLAVQGVQGGVYLNVSILRARVLSLAFESLGRGPRFAEARREAFGGVGLGEVQPRGEGSGKDCVGGSPSEGGRAECAVCEGGEGDGWLAREDAGLAVGCSSCGTGCWICRCVPCNTKHINSLLSFDQQVKRFT